MESTMIYYFIILTIATLVVVIIGMYRQLVDAHSDFRLADSRLDEVHSEVLELRTTVERQERQLEWWREQDNAGWTGDMYELDGGFEAWL